MKPEELERLVKARDALQVFLARFADLALAMRRTTQACVEMEVAFKAAGLVPSCSADAFAGITGAMVAKKLHETYGIDWAETQLDPDQPIPGLVHFKNGRFYPVAELQRAAKKASEDWLTAGTEPAVPDRTEDPDPGDCKPNPFYRQ